MPDLKTLQRAASEAAGKRQAPKKPSAAQPPPQPPRPSPPPFPSRHGKIAFTFHLHPDFKRGLRLIQAQRGHGCTLEHLAAEAFNDLFDKHDLPTVDGE